MFSHTKNEQVLLFVSRQKVRPVWKDKMQRGLRLDSILNAQCARLLRYPCRKFATCALIFNKFATCSIKHFDKSCVFLFIAK
jgi:hypothetical protein